MGGTVAVTVVEPNGTEHRMARWTNSMPWFVDNLDFIEKNPSHVKEYLDMWQGMREDWLSHVAECKKKNHIECNFKHNMTPCYGNYTCLAPNGYGLVLMDMHRNVVLSHQGYTRLGGIDIAAVGLDAMRMRDDRLEEKDSRSWQAQRLYDAGKISCVSSYDPKKDKMVEMPAPKSWKDILQLTESFRGIGYLVLDMSPFEVRDYEQQAKEGMLQMKKDIEALGFKLSEEEERCWQEYLDEVYSEE